MENLAIIVFVALQAIALAIALAYAWSRGRTLEEIRVESEEGRGAAFEFTIPVSDAPADRRQPERVPATARVAGA